jgi:hypothetical protein
MPDFNVRSDSVNVEQIMEQIRARIREKRGVDYTEQQIKELAAVKLEKFLDPRGVRSDLLSQFQQSKPYVNYEFEEGTLFETHRPLLRWIRRLMRPFLLLQFNYNKLIQVLHLQSELNERTTRWHPLYYELIHNLVIEVTQLGIEVKNLKMRVEALNSRTEFNERRARALESAVMYRPSTGEQRIETPVAPTPPAERGSSSVASQPGPVAVPAGGAPESPGQRSRRRRRRRGRRGGAPATATMGSPQSSGGAPQNDRSFPSADSATQQAAQAGQSQVAPQPREAPTDSRNEQEPPAAEPGGGFDDEQ